MTNLIKIKLAILGCPEVGKSAITVRYLTKKFIGEYSSQNDFLYRHTAVVDGFATDLEILDTSKCDTNGCMFEHLRWADAFMIVYSICDRRSFDEASEILKQITKLRLPSFYTTFLMANKSDLDHSRVVSISEGQELSLRFNSQFYEVSAAESYVPLSAAFQSLTREARSAQLLRGLPIRRKLGVNSVSKALGNIFGKNCKENRKKRPSLSI